MKTSVFVKGFLGSVTALLLMTLAPARMVAAGFDATSDSPAITGIHLENADVVITVQVPPGLKKITLQSSRRLGVVSWEPRAVMRLDGTGGEVTFRLPKSADLEMIRVRADESEPLPAFFYEGTSEFSGIPVGTSFTDPSWLVVAPGNAIDDRAAPGAPAEEASRSVVESDIWKIEGDTLYFFNQYRGLQVIDVNDPDAPVVRGTLPLPAAGEQMYLLPDERVVLLTRDPCGWGSESGSRILIVDAAGEVPTVIAALPLSGQIQESRMIGTALYVVTQAYRSVESREGIWEWGTRVEAFDLAEPSVPVARPGLWYGGYGNVLSATDRYLFVSVYDNSNNSLIHCVDISAPDGVMQKTGSIRAAGQVKDKFKMHLNGETFTVISEVWWSQAPDGTRSWSPVTKLETFSLADPAAPRKLGELELARGEQLHATRFDGDRVYVVTFFRIDPLWVVDLSDPAQPMIRGELHVPGWSTYIQPYGDRLIAIGIDDTNGWRVAVSLFDVRDPAAPSLLSKVPMGENSSWSEANSDEKAFGFLPEAGLILVPYSSYSTTREQGVQLIDFTPDSLVKRGFIAHALEARRSTVHGDRILSISGRELLTVDASDRDKPQVRAETELAWPVNRVFIQGDYLVELETSTDWNDQPQPALRVALAAGPERILNTLPLPDLPVIGASLRDGRLYLLQGATTYVPFLTDTADKTDGPDGTQRTTVLCTVLDLSNLPAVQVMGSAELAAGDTAPGAADAIWPKADVLVWVTRQANYWRWWGAVDSFVGDALVRGGPGLWPGFFNYGEPRLLAVDVRDPHSPEFASELRLTSTNSWPSFSKAHAADGLVFLSQQVTETSITGTNYVLITNTTPIRVTNSVTVTNLTADGSEVIVRTEVVKTPEETVVSHEQLVYTSRQTYYLDVVDYSAAANPLRRQPVPIPGQLQGMSQNGALLYLTGYALDQGTVPDWNEWLHVCAYDGVSTFAVDSLALPREWPHPILVREPHVFIARPEVEKTSTRAVEVWNLSQAGKLVRVGERSLSANAYSLHAVGDLLALQGESGIQLFDLNDPVALPLVGEEAVSTCLGWTLETAAGSMRDGLWLPLGFYGVHQIPIRK